MKKITAVLVFILALATTALAEEAKKCDTVSSAEDLWSYNRHREAITCLEVVKNADVTNNKAYFTEGKFCLALGEIACAKDNFSAGPVKAKYRSEIAELYKSEAEKKFASGDMNSAINLYGEMADYNPALARTVASELARKGKELNSDNRYLTVAVQLDPSLNTGIADHFAQLSDNSETDEEKVDNLKRSSRYDSMKYGQKANDASEALGRAFLAKAMENARKVGQEANTEKFKALARKYLGDAGDAIVKAELPEVFVLIPREEHYRFDIKKDEKIPYRLAVKYGTIVHLEYFSSNNKFEMRYKNHPTIKVWAGEKITNNIEDDEGTLVATEDTIVFIKVTKK